LIVRRMAASSVVLLFVLLAVLAGATPVLGADSASLQKLATIGLSDFRREPLMEMCLTYDEVKAGVSGNPVVTIVVEVGLIDIPALDIHSTQGRWEIGPMEFVTDFGQFCITNVDLSIDLADDDDDGQLIDRTGFDAKIEDFESHLAGEIVTSEIVPSDLDDSERDLAREIVDAIRSSNGLIPEFTIRVNYRIERQNDSAVLAQRTLSLVNTNPGPIRILAPTGSLLRPTLQFQLPSVPREVAYLENEIWIEDDSGRNVWAGYLPGGSLKIRYSSAQYGTIVTVPYPGAAPSLAPGASYTIVAKLRDPYGVEVDPDRLVGVRHDPEGQRYIYNLEIEPIELVSPLDVAPPRPTFEWRDPNPGEIRSGVRAYILRVGSQSFTVQGTQYTLPFALAEGEYTWSVDAIGSNFLPIAGMASEQGRFRISAEAIDEFDVADEPAAGDAIAGETVRDVPATDSWWEGLVFTDDAGSLLVSREDAELLVNAIFAAQGVTADAATVEAILAVWEQTGGSVSTLFELATGLPPAVGFVLSVMPGASLTIGGVVLDAETPVGPAHTLRAGQSVVARAGFGGGQVAVVRFTSPEGDIETKTLVPGTYLVTEECIQTASGSCL